MREQKPRLNVKSQKGVTVVALTDRKILDELSIREIGDQFNALVAASGEPKIVVDFSTVSHMSSAALGMLITLHKRVREKRGQLRLCCIQPGIYEVFVITRLNEILQITATCQEAVDSLA